uniref:ARAD1D07700p n=1 Tax=Blastobotrys adeninivorans TaxID=409370 RepID=A0A060TEI0_BLAAD
MKFQLLVAISAALASATPLAHHAHKRDLVTEVVHATKVVYQNAVVIVDQNGNPVQTTLQDVSTGVVTAAGQQETGAQNQAQVVQSSSQAQASSPAPETSSPAPQTSSPAAPETSSTPVQTSQAPTSQPPAPTTTSTTSQQQAPTSSSSSAAPSSTGGSGSGETFSGDATYYTPGLGACGWENSESDKIVALNVAQFGASSNGNENCGKKIRVQYNDKEVEVEVTDKCPGCKHGDLDLSPAAFDELADESEGRIQVTWSFV